MKYLIVGLGNVGIEYERTRHNIGFAVMDYLAEEAGIPFKFENHGDIAELRHKGRTFMLLKPSTYVNRSGRAVRYWLQKLKLEKTNLLVVLDDFNLPFGTPRLRGKGSDGGHNGLKDIDLFLLGNDYARLRIGIGNEFPRGGQVDHVLSEWTEEESEKLPGICKTAGEIVKSFGTIGLERTMNLYNK